MSLLSILVIVVLLVVLGGLARKGRLFSAAGLLAGLVLLGLLGLAIVGILTAIAVPNFVESNFREVIDGEQAMVASVPLNAGNIEPMEQVFDNGRVRVGPTGVEVVSGDSRVSVGPMGVEVVDGSERVNAGPVHVSRNVKTNVSFFGLALVPLLLVVAVVAFLILSRGKHPRVAAAAPGAGDLERLMSGLSKMEARMENLETILMDRRR